MTRFAILAVSCLALAACGDKSEPTQTDSNEASARGEVLGGSISDEMLPLGTVTSQSPPLESEDAEAPDEEDAADQSEATGEEE